MNIEDINSEELSDRLDRLEILFENLSDNIDFLTKVVRRSERRPSLGPPPRKHDNTKRMLTLLDGG